MHINSINISPITIINRI